MALLASTTIMLTLAPATANAQTAWGNYVPEDPRTLPQIPGCTWFADPDHPGLYQDWCGPDSGGNWYSPWQWYQITGEWPPDYGMGGG